MRIQVTTAADARRCQLFARLLPEGGAVEGDGPAARTAAAVLKRGEWKPRFRESLLVYGDGGGERLLLVGLGAEKEVDAEKVRRAAAIAYAKAKALEVRSLGIEVASRRVKPADLGNAIAEGVLLAAYETPTHKKKEKAEARPKRDLQVRIGADAGREAMIGGVERGRIVAEATNAARRLGDLPANDLTPSILAQEAQKVARANGLKAKVHRGPELERMKLGGLLAVARGSAEPPVLIEMSYRPRSFRRTVCLVGKGVTFDTGGISIKPSASMEEMKYDMCGAAAVLGAMQAAAALGLNVQVIGLVPATENMPSGTAQKPGDVLVTASGLSVEVVNTDAEGRLILADALHLATRHEPDYVVDVATLTGACVIALGHDAAGMYANDDGLAALLKQAGDETGDRVWPMPLFPEYQDDVKSAVADLKNIGKREGGAGSAAWFLKSFVGEHKWAHLDIAGTAWSGRARDYYQSGATGAGVRLLTRFLELLG